MCNAQELSTYSTYYRLPRPAVVVGNRRSNDRAPSHRMDFAICGFTISFAFPTASHTLLPSQSGFGFAGYASQSRETKGWLQLFRCEPNTAECSAIPCTSTSSSLAPSAAGTASASLLPFLRHLIPSYRPRVASASLATRHSRGRLRDSFSWLCASPTRSSAPWHWWKTKITWGKDPHAVDATASGARMTTSSAQVTAAYFQT